MFTKFIVNYQINTFEEFSKSIEFENITNGRKATILVDYTNNLIPLVRTTTIYNNPMQQFLPIHYDLIKNMKKISNIKDLELNNALVEIYDSRYRTMKFHSDQSLDLSTNSYICIFSCYDNPSTDIRKLKIKGKATGECSEILLEHNSVIIFSIETNKKYVHKIVLEKNTLNNKWLGITFRLSNTFIQFINDIPYFYPSNKILRISTNDERNEFRKYKGAENKQIGYNYSEIDYTLSIGDILPIK